MKDGAENNIHVRLQNVVMQSSGYSPQHDLSKDAITLPVGVFLVHTAWTSQGEMNDSGPPYACI